MLSCGNDLLTCGNKLVSCGKDFLTCGKDLISCGNDLLTCGNDFLTCGNELLTRGHNFLSRGNEIKRCQENSSVALPGFRSYGTYFLANTNQRTRKNRISKVEISDPYRGYRERDIFLIVHKGVT